MNFRDSNFVFVDDQSSCRNYQTNNPTASLMHRVGSFDFRVGSYIFWGVNFGFMDWSSGNLGVSFTFRGESFILVDGRLGYGDWKFGNMGSGSRIWVWGMIEKFEF